MSSNLRSGGQLLVDQLVINGVDLTFGVPGESYLHVLDAMHDVPSLRYIICRQEGGVAMMAEAYGKLTGRPGIAFVTRGPGATNASPGIHIAHQDSTPMILFVGQIGRGTTEREAFQEVDYRRFFGEMTKWVAQIDETARIPEFVHRAFMTATSGRPGPVVLALPEDMLAEKTDAEDGRPWSMPVAWPDPARMETLRSWFSEAERPFLILGGGGWTEGARANISRFAEANDLPVGVAFRRQDYIDNRHACYAGDIGIGPNPVLKKRVEEADLLIVLGARLGEMTTGGYSLFNIPKPKQRLVHIHNGADELGRVYQPDLAILAGVPAAAERLAALEPPSSRPWAANTAELHQSYLQHTGPVTIPGTVQMAEIMAYLNDRLPDDAIVTNGAGNYSAWPNRFYRYRAFRSQLAPTSGSMGYGLPAAVAAKITCPDRPVICFAGDGCFLMNGQELATASQHGAAIIVLVINNGMYGTIRMHQERDYPGRESGTHLDNPDFVKLGEAYGCWSTRVTQTEEFAPALEDAMASGKPALIELMVDPEAITPRVTLSEIREKALAGAKF